MTTGMPGENADHTTIHIPDHIPHTERIDYAFRTMSILQRHPELASTGTTIDDTIPIKFTLPVVHNVVEFYQALTDIMSGYDIPPEQRSVELILPDKNHPYYGLNFADGIEQSLQEEIAAEALVGAHGDFYKPK